MSPTMNTSVQAADCITSPVDTMDRSEFGVQKNRKPASTGGGRAWSEDEEVYLLQTRLQKMPYKHIAAHLKKTELACRLHYHQLSHGSNRRKRTTSESSGSDNHSHATQSPIISRDSMSPPSTSHGYAHPYSPEQSTIHLPPTSSLLPRSASTSPSRTLHAILPKPSPARATQSSTPPLRLDCALPPMAHVLAPEASISRPSSTQPTPKMPFPDSTASNFSNIDLPRLISLYATHRTAFWSAIACEYGPAASAAQLEDVWLRYQAAAGAVAPPTPCISPDGRDSGGVYGREKEVVMGLEKGKTSISALLGIDASPRSPRERELIRRMEEGRVGA